MVKILETVEAFRDIEEAWNLLYKSAEEMTPFQSFIYNYLSWTVYMKSHGSLYIITIYSHDNKKLEAIFPCYIDNNKYLRFINDRDTDFCNAIIDKDIVSDFRLYEELSDRIKKDDRIRGIRWDNLEYNNHLKSALLPFFKVIYLHDINAYSKIDIYHQDSDKSFLDAIRNINGQRRKKLKKELQQESNLRFLFLEKREGFPFPKKEIYHLVHLMVTDKIRKQEYFSEEMIQFWMQMYDNNLLTITLLFQNEEIKAINFLFHSINKNEYIKWIILYADKRYNSIINLKLIEYLYKEDFTTINYARGIYDYKMKNYHPTVYCLYRLEIEKTFSNSLRGLISLNKHYAKKIIKSFLHL